MAERNQADVQGQGQGGPGDEEVLMELLRRLARGREEPKQEAGPRRMTRADRTQRINEQRRAANAWGMSPAKRKYLQEQAEKRYQRRAEQKEEIRKRNLAKRGIGVEMGPPAPVPGPVGPGAGVPRPEPSFDEMLKRGPGGRPSKPGEQWMMMAEEGGGSASAGVMGPERAMPGPSQFEGGGLGVEAGVMGPQRVQPGPVGGGVTDEMLRDRIQARARGSQSVPMPSGPQLTPEMGVPRMLDPREAEAAAVRQEQQERQQEMTVRGAYDRMLRRRIQGQRLAGGLGLGTGLLGRFGTAGRGMLGAKPSGRREAFRELLGDMGLELQDAPMEAGLSRDFVENLAYENLQGFERGEQMLDPTLFKRPDLASRRDVLERAEGLMSWREMGPPAWLR